MRICLVSRDRRVESLCRESLAKLGGECSLSLDPTGSLARQADLTIVDQDDFPDPPGKWESGNGTAPIFLYSEQDIQGARGALPAAIILLKPLQRELFMTVLSCIAQQHRMTETSRNDAAGAIPADELVQRLIHTNLELQRFHGRQMDFLSQGLHDLRAPLTAIEGYGGLLLAERFGPLTAVQRENLRRMQRSVGRLSRMATEMFRLSLEHRSEREPVLRPANINACVQHVIREMAPLAQTKGIRVSDDLPAAAGALHFDVAQIQSVLTNLLENACRFTPRNGTIELRGDSVFWERRCPEVLEPVAVERRSLESRKPNAYRVDVRDCGPGIPAGRLESIFEPYVSYGAAHDRGGAGLGLAICRMIIAAHRGSVFAASSGAGAVFSFILPFAEPRDQSVRRRPPDRESADRRRASPEPDWGIAEETA